VASVSQSGASSSPYAEQDRAAGWLVFAASMLGLAGIMSVIDGIMALSRSRFYVAGATYAFSDLRTWGWIALGVGALLIIAAMGVLSGSAFSRWFGIFAAALNAVAYFAYVQAYPFWSLIVIAISILVIYALATYGGKRDIVV
jgi:hypothetical protein